jgi:TPP-dependent pyruvate/acetoin dehydrogenase alpha subunit
VGRELLVEMQRRMLRIRLFEEAVAAMAANGEIPGVVHLSIGQEATVVGACVALQEKDYMTGTHRSHGHPIAKGARIAPLMAELLGKRTGVCKGKGGSMHLADFSVGSLGESGVLASSMPVAVGAGLSAKTRKTDQVCLSFFGDGAVNEGAFHESLNLAAVWSLPVIFCCENNNYAVAAHVSELTSVKEIASRSTAYGIPGAVVDGQDVVAVHQVVSEAVERARGGQGPSLIEAKTYRYREHAEGLRLHYRPEGELESWMARDPIELHRTRLLESGVSEDELDELRVVEQAEVERAVEFARESPFPDPSEAFEGLYAQPFATIR